MATQTLKQYASWIAVGILTFSVLVYGINLSNKQSLLKVAVNEKDPLAMELVEILKTQFAVTGSYKLAAVKTSNSRESQSKLLKGEVDLAIALPATLTQSTGMRTLAPLASMSTFMLVDSQYNMLNIGTIDSENIALGEKESDQYFLLEGLLSSVNREGWIKNSPPVSIGALAESDSLQMGIVTTIRQNKLLKQLLGTNRYLLQSLPADALSLQNPFWQKDQIGAASYLAGHKALPEAPVETLSTFLALLTTEKLNSTVAVDVARVVNSADSRLALSAFGVKQAALMSGYELLPQHSAVARSFDDKLASRYFSAIASFVADYGAFVVLFLVFSAVVGWKFYSHRNDLSKMRRLQQVRMVDGLIQELQKVDERIGLEHDIKTLRGLYEGVQSIRNRGTVLIMKVEDYPQSHAYLFNEQCQFSISRLEARLSAAEHSSARLSQAA